MVFITHITSMVKCQECDVNVELEFHLIALNWQLHVHTNMVYGLLLCRSHVNAYNVMWSHLGKLFYDALINRLATI